MPTYEYECKRCKRTFEYFQFLGEPQKTKCEVCGGKLTKLLSSGAGVIFKGSGFYATDYKAPERKEKGEHPDDASRQVEAKPKSKTEKKKKGESDTTSSKTKDQEE
jgi:putative FmdB family regulatory protein